MGRSPVAGPRFSSGLIHANSSAATHHKHKVDQDFFEGGETCFGTKGDMGMGKKTKKGRKKKGERGGRVLLRCLSQILGQPQTCEIWAPIQ